MLRQPRRKNGNLGVGVLGGRGAVAMIDFGQMATYEEIRAGRALPQKAPRKLRFWAAVIDHAIVLIPGLAMMPFLWSRLLP